MMGFIHSQSTDISVFSPYNTSTFFFLVLTPSSYNLPSAIFTVSLARIFFNYWVAPVFFFVLCFLSCLQSALIVKVEQTGKAFIHSSSVCSKLSYLCQTVNKTWAETICNTPTSGSQIQVWKITIMCCIEWCLSQLKLLYVGIFGIGTS